MSVSFSKYKKHSKIVLRSFLMTSFALYWWTREEDLFWKKKLWVLFHKLQNWLENFSWSVITITSSQSLDKTIILGTFFRYRIQSNSAFRLSILLLLQWYYILMQKNTHFSVKINFKKFFMKSMSRKFSWKWLSRKIISYQTIPHNSRELPM